MKNSRLSEHVVRNVPIPSIRENPRNQDYHADFDPKGRDAWLVDDIRQNGVLVPAVVGPDGRSLEDGHRRKWACEYLKMETMPVVVCSESGEKVFRSAQLHRNLTVYAKVKLYRGKIEELVRRGNSLKGAGHDKEKSHQLDDEWDAFSAAAGVSRNKLHRGLNLLRKVEELRNSTSLKDQRHAEILENTFRCRGVTPAEALAAKGKPGGRQEEEAGTAKVGGRPQGSKKPARQRRPDVRTQCRPLLATLKSELSKLDPDPVSISELVEKLTHIIG